MARGLLLAAIGTIATSWIFLKYFTLSTATFDPEEQISGKNVLLTGASSGIGREMALQLCAMGANVFITARRETLLKQVIEECKARGPSGAKYGYHPADMGNMEQAENVVLEAGKFLGSLDYLILDHAYVSSSLNFYKMDDQGFAELQKYMNVNFFSFVKMTAAAMPYLVRSQGKIGVVSSDSGEVPTIMSEYCASKYAVNGFFGSLDLDFYTRNTNVSITIAVIGAIDTPGFKNFVDSMEKLGKTEEVFAMNTPQDCAYEIIKGTAVRQPVVYFPNEFSIWGANIYNKLFPQSFREWTRDVYKLQ